MLYTTKDLSSLFKITQKKGDKIYGFDILNDGQLTSFNAKDVIRFDPNSKLVTYLIRSEQIRLELVEILFDKAEEQAEYLGLSERTLFRIKNTVKTCCTT